MCSGFPVPDLCRSALVRVVRVHSGVTIDGGNSLFRSGRLRRIRRLPRPIPPCGNITGYFLTKSGVFIMSGHSKWHTIKHKKGAADAKRGKIFTRIIKELTVAARGGGGDPDMNPRLRTIVAEAKAVNMPRRQHQARDPARHRRSCRASSTKRSPTRATAPAASRIIIETLTDNKNRTVGEIRHMLGKYGGNLARREQRRLDVRQEGLHRRREGQGRRGDADGRGARRRRRRHARRRRQLGNRVARPTRSRRCSRRSRRSASSRPPPRSRCCRRTTSSSKASRRSRWSS